MNNLNNNNQMVNEVKRELPAVEAVNCEAKNIQNFGFSIDACKHLEPTILRVFVQNESNAQLLFWNCFLVDEVSSSTDTDSNG